MNLSTLLILATGAATSFWRLSDDLEKEKYSGLELQRATGSDQLAALFFERYGDIKAIAANPVVDTRDFDHMSKYFDHYIELYGIYDHIMYINTDGKWMAGSTKDVSGKPIHISEIQKHDFKTEEWFQRVLKKQWNTTPSGSTGIVISKFQYWSFLENVLDEKVPHQFIATAIYDPSGKIEGILASIIHPRWMMSMFKEKLMRKMAVGDTESIVWIIQDNKVIVKGWIDGNEVKFDYPMVEEESLFGISLKEAIRATKYPIIRTASGTKYVFSAGQISSSRWSPELSWKVVYSEREDTFFKEAHAEEFLVAIVIVLCLVLAVIVNRVFAAAVVKRLDEALNTFGGIGKNIAETSESLLKAGHDLASSSTQQSAAVQETMAALEQISAMVSRNADAAEKSHSQSLEAEEAASRGQETVQKMLESMQQIKESNEHYSSELAQANERLNEITQAINEIVGKTKIINEIVFQTKLLSFNASVEAARAGEYGKGFAVVAEEVGNLAAMSGQAAKEISQLLEKSTKQVTEVVEASKNLSDVMVQTIQEKVENAEQVASEVAHALQDILLHSQKVTGMASEISTASREQASGVAEISKAIGEIQIGIQKVNQNAHQASNDSRALDESVKRLKISIEEIFAFLKGAMSRFGNGSTSGKLLSVKNSDQKAA